MCWGCRKDGALVSATGDLTNRLGHVLHLGIDPHSRFSTVLTGRRLGDQPCLDKHPNPVNAAPIDSH